MSKKATKEMIGGCCVCSDESGWNENPLVYCDGAGCNVAVHQACYGIVQVPSGPWFCRKCESQERVARVKCELCPQRAGALKRTDSGGWCHVVCALYVPEAWFADVQTMEPIVLKDVPSERFNKVCYICEEQKRDTKATAGACMQCNRNSCKQFFHVTCAQTQGLLCEVSGHYDNVKYCGYCSHHYKKLKNVPNVKTIPAFKPIPNENSTPDTSPEKNTNTPGEEVRTVPLSIPEVKSPQVDQSVSSTSDSVQPPVIPNVLKPEVTPLACGGQVSDITSAVSPSGEMAPPNGEPQHQEPSSSGVLVLTPTLTQMLQDGASSSTENGDIDVDDVSKDALPRESQSIPLRHRRTTELLEKLTSKKTKSNTISSSVTSQPESGLRRTTRKHRDLTGVRKLENPSALKPPAPAATSLLGHHDYCGSLWRASPSFPSLSSVSDSLPLPSLSSQNSSSPPNGASLLIPPPKYFPSLMNTTTKYSQDHLQELPLSMEQLLEQQWDQGAQFLMEHGQHFDISSLLNCLHRLKGENQSLENQVKELTSRRDHLLAINARLSLPLSLYDEISSQSKSSSVGSLEDISSPDDIQTPRLGLAPLAAVQIPSSSELIVEDILSPAETDHSLPPASRLKPHLDGTGSARGYMFTDQLCPPQPLMYSVVNPPPTLLAVSTSAMYSLVNPPPTLAAVNTLSTSSSTALSPSLLSAASSAPALPASNPTMPKLELMEMPSLSGHPLSGMMPSLSDVV